eukprot:GHRR01012258.1.p1 GENE.GHRR01012258.1~~GHRR01012258.1.p1  ORF type:complete len:433 (+),score=130.19 GHRR01012258.1:664-1962(+)
MVWRAAAAGSDRLNFVPTHHWLSVGDIGSNRISGFCYMQHTSDGSPNRCSPWTDDVISEFKHAMTLCFTEALRQGLTLYVRPHLDDGTANGAWRNGLLLRPQEKHSGYSYYDIMLAPLADAVRDALAAAAEEGKLRTLPGHQRPVVYFATQGEMSACIMRYASDWAKLVQPLKTRITTQHADVKIGVGLNFNRLDDTTSVSKTYESSRLSWMMWLMDAEGQGGGDVPPVDAAGLVELFNNQLDFVGISAYAPFTGPDMELNEFENSAFMFAEEMQNYGVNVQSLISSGKVELQYSEFGLGGGGSYGGGQVARNPGDVALRPFFGIYGVYAPDKDPWAIASNKAYRREFFSKALAWLAEPNNKSYKISSVFIWSMASWDVLGIYPESTSASGSFRDDKIADGIKKYNLAVLRAQGSGSRSGDNISGSQPAAGR